MEAPGVYIQEIAGFPQVVPVPTAIPAFIGYTEKAGESAGDSLVRRPTRITSISEYEQHFGKARVETGSVVGLPRKIPGGRVLVRPRTRPGKDLRPPFVMYYALQLYFENGGGPCYIVSAGTFSDPAVRAPELKDLRAALDVLASEDEPTLIVFPEALALPARDYYDLQKQALAQCAMRGNRFVLMDVVPHGGGDSTDIEAFRNGIGTENLKYGAAYFPHVVTSIRSADGLELVLPASPAIAGVYARVDAQQGVWKAPANVSLNRVVRPAVSVTDRTQEDLNVHASGKSINAIRTFPGRGILVWGARTLAGNDSEWRYVNVRRYFNMVEASLKKALQPFAFEQNEAATWSRVRTMIEDFLNQQWRNGALAGTKPDHAYFVRIGLGQTMTAQDLQEGRMIVEIGLAMIRPAEFIILRIVQKMQVL